MHWKSLAAFVILCCGLCVGQQTAPASPQAKSKTAAISGTVTRADTHLPLKNVQVIVMGRPESAPASDGDDAGTQTYQSSANTDEKGHFEFADLAPGIYSVRAMHTGMVLKGAEQLNGVLVYLQAGEPQNLILMMVPGGAITGRVLNEEGEPMQNVSVAALRYVYTIAGRHLTEAKKATSDDKGEYRLFGLKPGSYLLLADTAPNFENGDVTGITIGTSRPAGAAKKEQKVYAPTYYQNEGSPDRAAPIVLKPGDETRADFTLVRVSAHHISGKISGITPPKSDDKPDEAGCFVMANRQGSQFPVAFARVGKNSSFDIGPVAPGKYTISATQQSSDHAVSGSKEVVVNAADVTGITIALAGGSRQIKGVVRAESDTKIDYSKLLVVLVPAGDSEDSSESMDIVGLFQSGSATSEVGKDGSFKLDISPSTKLYQLVLSARGTGLEDWFTSKVVAGGKDVLMSGFKITESEPRTLEVVVSDKGAAIEGTALNAEKKPFPNAEVIAVPSDPKLRKHFELIQKTTADQEGRFKLRGVRPGEYIAMALEYAEEQPFLEDRFLTQNSSQVQTIKAEAGGKQKIELQVIRTETQ
jgi:protocatechuate 3,4-dioxygenase beta subunit